MSMLILLCFYSYLFIFFYKNIIEFIFLPIQITSINNFDLKNYKLVNKYNFLDEYNIYTFNFPILELNYSVYDVYMVFFYLFIFTLFFFIMLTLPIILILYIKSGCFKIEYNRIRLKVLYYYSNIILIYVILYKKIIYYIYSILFKQYYEYSNYEIDFTLKFNEYLFTYLVINVLIIIFTLSITLKGSSNISKKKLILVYILMFIFFYSISSNLVITFIVFMFYFTISEISLFKNIIFLFLWKK